MAKDEPGLARMTAAAARHCALADPGHAPDGGWFGAAR